MIAKMDTAFLIVMSILSIVNGDKLTNVYLPPSGASSSGGHGGFLQAPPSFGTQQISYSGFGSRSSAPAPAPAPSHVYSAGVPSYTQAGFGAPGHIGSTGGAPQPVVPIVSQSEQPNLGDGSYSFSYETGNGIKAEEKGAQKVIGSEAGSSSYGSFSFTGTDGVVYTVQYTSDENGFQPKGDHLPTPPPIPEEILKGLEQIAQAEASGIKYDDQGNLVSSAKGYQSGPAPSAGFGGYSQGGYQQPARVSPKISSQPKPYNPAPQYPTSSFSAQPGYSYIPPGK